jgi:hypothetical protein
MMVMMTMMSILNVAAQDDNEADQHAGMTQERRAETAHSSPTTATEIPTTQGVAKATGAWYAKAYLATIVSVVVASLVSVVGFMVPAGVLAMAPLFAIAALLWLRHSSKKLNGPSDGESGCCADDPSHQRVRDGYLRKHAREMKAVLKRK